MDIFPPKENKDHLVVVSRDEDLLFKRGWSLWQRLTMWQASVTAPPTYPEVVKIVYISTTGLERIAGRLEAAAEREYESGLLPDSQMLETMANRMRGHLRFLDQAEPPIE